MFRDLHGPNEGAIRSYRICSDGDLIVVQVLDEPCPAATLDARKRGVEPGLDLAQIAVRSIYGVCQGSRRRFAAAGAFWCQILPK